MSAFEDIPFDERVRMLWEYSVSLCSNVHPSILRAQCVMTLRFDEMGAPQITDPEIVAKVALALAQGKCIMSRRLESTSVAGSCHVQYGTLVLNNVTGTLPPP
jgi:hypothetical protein